MGAQDIGFAAFHRLQNIGVVRVPQERRSVSRIENHNVGHALEQLCVFQKISVFKPVEVLKMRVAKHPCYLGDHFVGQHQPVAALQNFME
jgi:hypothetical protein